MTWHFVNSTSSPEQAGESSAESFSDMSQSAPSNWRHTLGLCCCNDSGTGCSHGSPSGMMSAPSTGNPGPDGWMSSVVASPARTFPQQARVRESVEPGLASGLSSHGSLARYDRATASWRTAPCLLPEASTAFLGTWPRWGTMRNGVCWALATPERRTSGRGSGYWQTPVSDDSVERTKGKFNSRGEPKLSGQVMMWPTPVADRDRTTNYAQGGTSLGFAVRAFPTPNDSDHITRKTSASWKAKGRVNFVLSNPEVQATWPTPTARDWKQPGAAERAAERAQPLSEVVGNPHVYATPQARDYRTGQQSRSEDPDRTKNVNDQIGSQLNPTWTEWLMGWPLGWTATGHLSPTVFRAWLEGCVIVSPDSRPSATAKFLNVLPWPGGPSPADCEVVA